MAKIYRVKVPGIDWATGDLEFQHRVRRPRRPHEGGDFVSVVAVGENGRRPSYRNQQRSVAPGAVRLRRASRRRPRLLKMSRSVRSSRFSFGSCASSSRSAVVRQERLTPSREVNYGFTSWSPNAKRLLVRAEELGRKASGLRTSSRERSRRSRQDRGPTTSTVVPKGDLIVFTSDREGDGSSTRS